MLVFLVALVVFFAAGANTKSGAQLVSQIKQLLGLGTPETTAPPLTEKPKSLYPSSKTLDNAPDFIPTPKPDLTLTPETIDNHDARDHIYANKVIRYPYHQTMAHQPMLSEHWIEPDRFYRSDMEYKKKLVEVQGKTVLDTLPLPPVQAACTELMEQLSDWLPARYPKLFERPTPNIIKNLVTGESLSLVDTNGTVKRGNEALEVVSRLVQDDFLISHPNEANDGSWIVAGGVVCFPGFYLLSHKIGKSLARAHDPVPQFNEKILKSVERSLTRLHPSQPIERTSWEFVDKPDDLFWTRLAGPLPLTKGLNGAAAKPMMKEHLEGRDNQMTSEEVGDLLLRLDHQTFIKMPKSGSVFFGVHPMRRKLRDLEEMPLIPQLLVKVMRESSRDLLEYKGTVHYEDVIIPYLQDMHKRQIDSGLITGDEDVKNFREVKAALDAGKAGTAV